MNILSVDDKGISLTIDIDYSIKSNENPPCILLYSRSPYGTSKEEFGMEILVFNVVLL